MCARSRPLPSVLRLSFLLLVAGCTLAPEGTQAEFERASLAGSAWSAPPGERELPELPAAPTSQDVVARALLANGELEAAWHEWRAALERVLVASGWPDTNLAVGLTSFVTHGSLWDTSAVSLGFDPMQMLSLPAKVRQAGEEAFHEALAAGRRFESARLMLRERVLGDWLEWSLLGERLRAAEQRADLADALSDTAAAGVRVGGAQEDLLRRRMEAADQAAELEQLRAEVPARRAALNALLAREPDAPLALPEALPAPRARPADADVLALGVASNPELQELADMAGARAAGLRLAELRWFPDVAPSAQAGGGMDESWGLMFTLPINVPAVEAAVRAARADLDAARARLAQAERDAAGRVLAILAELAGDEARLQRLEQIEPAARAMTEGARQSYVHGGAGLSGMAEAQRAELDLRLAVSEARVAREQRLLALERAVGLELRAPAADPLARGDAP